MTNTRPFAVTQDEILRNPADAAAYLEVALEDEDRTMFLVALGNVARAYGVSEVARKAGLNRESLYRMLSPDGNPELRSVEGVLNALGLKLTVTPKAA